MDQAINIKNNSSSRDICYICKRVVEPTDNVVECSICGVKMHKRCIDEEILTDAEGAIMCPYDSALAALDWFDSIISTYSSSFTDEQREEIIERLKNYINMLTPK